MLPIRTDDLGVGTRKQKDILYTRWHRPDEKTYFSSSLEKWVLHLEEIFQNHIPKSDNYNINIIHHHDGFAMLQCKVSQSRGSVQEHLGQKFGRVSRARQYKNTKMHAQREGFSRQGIAQVTRTNVGRMRACRTFLWHSTCSFFFKFNIFTARFCCIFKFYTSAESPI